MSSAFPDRFIPFRRDMFDLRSNSPYPVVEDPTQFQKEIYQALFGRPPKTRLFQSQRNQRKVQTAPVPQNQENKWKITTTALKSLEAPGYCLESTQPLAWTDKKIAVLLEKSCCMVPMEGLEVGEPVIIDKAGDAIKSVCWNRGGTEILLGGPGQEARIYDLATQKLTSFPLENVPEHMFIADSLFVSIGPTETYTSRLSAYDTRTLEPAFDYSYVLNDEKYTALKKNNFQIFAGTDKGTVFVYDIRNSMNYLFKIAMANSPEIKDIQLHPSDEKKMLIGSNKGIALYSTYTQELMREITPEAVNSMLWLNNRTLVAAFKDSDPLKVFDLFKEKQVGEISAHLDGPSRTFLAAGPYGQYFCGLSDQNQSLDLFGEPLYHQEQKTKVSAIAAKLLR